MSKAAGVSSKRSQIKLLFAGNCHQTGYEGVPQSATFPVLARRMLSARFPSLSFKFETKNLHDPRGLKPLLRARLMLSSPDIVVIMLPAVFAATGRRVNLIHQMAPEVLSTAHSLMWKIGSKLKGTSGGVAARNLLDRSSAWLQLDRLSTWFPPVTLDEYERLIEDGIEYCRRTAACCVVLMGPGGFNEDTKQHYSIHSPELWSSVNQMVLRVGQQLSVPVINAHDAQAGGGGEVYLPNNHRWSRYGHEIVAREVECVLAANITALSLSRSERMIGLDEATHRQRG